MLGGGPVSVRSIAESGDVPSEPEEWSASIVCAEQFSGLLQFTFFVWDANSSAVYDPIDFQIQWSCAVPGCDPLCESLGKGTCEYLLGECRCRDGYSGVYCGYKLAMNRTQRPGVPVQLEIEVQAPTGFDWVQLVDPDAGIEYDFRYLATWSHDTDSANLKKMDHLAVKQTFQTYLPPGHYKLSFFRDSFNRPMGVEQITVLPWDNETCINDSDCNDGLCVNGSCVCSSSRFGGHCERGCSNYTELVGSTGVVQSDQGESSLERAMYTANDRCTWVIAPNGSRGDDWDYIHIEFDWVNVEGGDRIEIWSGPDLQKAELVQTFTTRSEVPHIKANLVVVGFISDYESGAAGFRLHYTVGKNRRRRDPKLVNLPVEMDGTKAFDLYLGTPAEMSPAMTNQTSSPGYLTTAVPSCYSASLESSVIASVAGLVEYSVR
eukprot:m51a1_g4226 hypothetical protein (434) ;mRNA; r:105690-107615